MPEMTPLQSLIGFLRDARATPVLSPERQAPSAVYDLQYRLVVSACAFEIHAKANAGTHRITAPRLKLVQFIAIRPWLLPIVRRWSAARSVAQLSLLNSHLRQGFLGDGMHDDVVALLVARDVLRRSGGHLLSGVKGPFLTELHDTATRLDLFAAERATLSELLHVKITNSMLEGW
jgi:hypothetical protein